MCCCVGPQGERTEQGAGSPALWEHVALGDAAATALCLALPTWACPGFAGVSFPRVSFLGGGMQGPRWLRPGDPRGQGPGVWKECPGKGHGLPFPQDLPWIPEAPFCLFELASVSGLPQVSRHGGHPKGSSALKRVRHLFSGST